MITISQKIESIILNSPYLREALSENLINLSALARKIAPSIEAELKKNVTEGAVLIALQRYTKSMKPFNHVNPAKYLANLSLKSGLFEITVENSDTSNEELLSFSKEISNKKGILFVFTQGQYETTIIMSEKLKDKLFEFLKNEKITSTIPELTGISLERTHGQIETTGVLYYPLKVLAWEDISVIEIVTTLNDIMIVVRNFEVDKAIISLRRALETLSKLDS